MIFFPCHIRQIAKDIVEYDVIIEDKEVTITLKRDNPEHVTISFYPGITLSSFVIAKVINDHQVEISVRGQSTLVDI